MDQSQKMEYITVVDKDGKYLGKEEKEKCHLGKGILHSAFLVMVFNEKSELMLAKRSKRKSLWPDYWDGTVASHYHSEVNQEKTIKDRILHEIGVCCDHINNLFKFRYQVEYRDIGSENEICDVFVARDINSGDVSPNESEISEVKFLDIPELKEEIQENSKKYAPWFLIALEKYNCL
jgi:isopentenyl-diphosphate delta-isomerase